jgi:hypothetical protein
MSQKKGHNIRCDDDEEDEDHKLNKVYFVPSAISIGNNENVEFIIATAGS